MARVHRAQDEDRHRPHQGRRVPVQEEQDRAGSKAPAASPATDGRGDRRRRRAHADRPRDHRRHRIGAAQRARHRDRPQAHHHQRRSDRTLPKCRSRSPSWAAARSAWSSRRSSAASAATVTLIELLPRIVPNEDEAVSAELEKAFRKRGIAVRTATKVTSASGQGRQRHDRDGERRRQDGVADRRERCWSRPDAAR